MKHLILCPESTNAFLTFDGLLAAMIIRRHLSVDNLLDITICDTEYLEAQSLVIGGFDHIHLLDLNYFFEYEDFRKYKEQGKIFHIYTIDTLEGFDEIEEDLFDGTQDNIYVETDYYSLSNAVFELFFDEIDSCLLDMINHVRSVANISDQDEDMKFIFTGVGEALKRIAQLQQPPIVSTHVCCSLLETLLYMDKQQLYSYCQDVLSQMMAFVPTQGMIYTRFESKKTPEVESKGLSTVILATTNQGEFYLTEDGGLSSSPSEAKVFSDEETANAVQAELQGSIKDNFSTATKYTVQAVYLGVKINP